MGSSIRAGYLNLGFDYSSRPTGDVKWVILIHMLFICRKLLGFRHIDPRVPVYKSTSFCVELGLIDVKDYYNMYYNSCPASFSPESPLS